MTLRDMSVEELANSCTREMHNYRQERRSDDRYCLEILRRAIAEHDVYAWEVLQERLKPIVIAWIHRHQKRDIACRLDSEENYVALTFERFWQAVVHNQQLEFSSLAAALRYLHASLNGTIIDALRAYIRPQEIPLPDPGFPGEPTVEDEASTEQLEIILSFLPNPRERRLAYLLFHCGLKPRQIVAYCPQEFNNVQEIYQLRRTIMERLQRNLDSLRWRLAYDYA